MGSFRKVVVLGLDGFDPKIAERLLSRGELPHLRRLSEGKVCVRYFQRPDGTVMTRDCRSIVQDMRRWWIGACAAVGALLLGLIAWTVALAGRSREPSDLRQIEPFRSVLQWVDPAPPVVMGEPCPNPPPGKGAQAPPKGEGVNKEATP